jgi:hypothetical protein
LRICARLSASVPVLRASMWSNSSATTGRSASEPVWSGAGAGFAGAAATAGVTAATVVDLCPSAGTRAAEGSALSTASAVSLGSSGLATKVARSWSRSGPIIRVSR